MFSLGEKLDNIYIYKFVYQKRKKIQAARFDVWIKNNVFSHVISDLTIENRENTIDFMRTRLCKQTF